MNRTIAVLFLVTMLALGAVPAGAQCAQNGATTTGSGCVSPTPETAEKVVHVHYHYWQGGCACPKKAAAAATACGNAAAPRTASSRAMKHDYVNRMGDVIEEISLVNLLRGLYLNKTQTLAIQKLALQAQKERDTALRRVEELNSLPVLEKLRDDLYTSLPEDPPADRSHAVKMDNRAHDIIGESLDRIAKLEDEVCRVLTRGQMDIFWKFAPCIVPEVDFENPVRTGQAGGSSRMYGVVEHIRNADDETWKKHGKPFLRYLLKLFEQEVGKMTDDVRDDLYRRITRVAWKIRQMDEGEYLLHRSALAEELMIINREHTVRSGFRTTGKVARFFLSPAAVAVFPKWIDTHFRDGQEPVRPEGAVGPCGFVIPAGKSAAKTPNNDACAPAVNGTPAANSCAPAAPAADKPAGAKPGENRPTADKQGACPTSDPEAASSQQTAAVELPDVEGVVDDDFWRGVPEACRYVAETPYWDHAKVAFAPPWAQLLFSEEHKDVDFATLLNNALIVLHGKGTMTYYSATPGEP